MTTGPTKKTRLLVLQRDLWACQVCGRNLAREVLDGFGYSLQHRRARGMGGSKRPDTNSPANLLTTCGSATSPGNFYGMGGCHHRIESQPTWAADYGYRLRQNQTPSEVPVWTYSHGWVLLDDSGGTTPTSPRTAPTDLADPPTGVRMGQTSRTRQKGTYCRCGDPECPISLDHLEAR